MESATFGRVGAVISDTCLRLLAAPSRGGRRWCTRRGWRRSIPGCAPISRAGHTGGGGRCARGLVEPGDRGEAPLKGDDGLVDGDPGGVAGELVAAGGPALGADEAGLAERRQELIEVLLGDVAAESDLGALQGALAVVVGQLDQGPQPVVAPCGTAHLPLPATAEPPQEVASCLKSSKSVNNRRGRGREGQPVAPNGHESGVKRPSLLPLNGSFPWGWTVRLRRA